MLEAIFCQWLSWKRSNTHMYQVSAPCIAWFASDFVEYPDHPQVSQRSKCNTPLLKKITVGKGAKLVPRKVFVYHSIISTLNSLINRKDFLCKCEHWRNRKKQSLSWSSW